MQPCHLNLHKRTPPKHRNPQTHTHIHIYIYIYVHTHYYSTTSIQRNKDTKGEPRHHKRTDCIYTQLSITTETQKHTNNFHNNNNKDNNMKCTFSACEHIALQGGVLALLQSSHETSTPTKTHELICISQAQRHTRSHATAPATGSPTRARFIHLQSALLSVLCFVVMWAYVYIYIYIYIYMKLCYYVVPKFCTLYIFYISRVFIIYIIYRHRYILYRRFCTFIFCILLHII